MQKNIYICTINIYETMRHPPEKSQKQQKQQQTSTNENAYPATTDENVKIVYLNKSKNKWLKLVGGLKEKVSIVYDGVLTERTVIYYIRYDSGTMYAIIINGTVIELPEGITEINTL